MTAWLEAHWILVPVVVIAVHLSGEVLYWRDRINEVNGGKRS